MAKRKIIKIDEKKCNGCGKCLPKCPEGALQIIDGKVRLVSDLFCDGLGACIGHCPQGAISIEEREAIKYDEKKVMQVIVRQGENVVKAHLEHLKEHNQDKYLKEALDFLKENNIPISESRKTQVAHAACGCQGSKVMDLRQEDKTKNSPKVKIGSELRQWPVQIHLVPVNASYFENADILIAADCVGFAYANFHQDLLKGKILLVGCPKLDDAQSYQEKLADIFKNNKIKSITCAHMQVPCCFGLMEVLESAIENSGKDIALEEIIIGVRGERLQ